MMLRLRVVSATMVAFLITGVVVQSLSSEAAAQERASATPWEYRAVDFRPGHTVDEHTKQLNDLASAGWEYVGVLIPPFSHGNLAPKSTVVFRRSTRVDNAGRRGSLPSKSPDGDSQEHDDAKRTQARRQIDLLRMAARIYTLDVGTSLSGETGLGLLLSPPAQHELRLRWRGPYIQSPAQLQDPWGHAYRLSTEGHVFSSGPDGVPGSDDDLHVSDLPTGSLPAKTPDGNSLDQGTDRTDAAEQPNADPK